jgi:cation-dependent mannose-6-phosphate receptor
VFSVFSFFSLVTAYLVIGGIYMHVKRGARGLDHIPNLEMWRKLGHLSADGCDFCCRCERNTTRAGYFLDETGPDIRGDDDILSP